jgi:hypothetical protein
MKLSKSQQQRFWRDWSAACRVQGWVRANGFDTAAIDAKRKLLLKSCGFTSLTQVDRSQGFDRLLAALGLLNEDLARTTEVGQPEAGDRRRYLHNLERAAAALGGLPYALAIARDQFGITNGQSTLEDLTTAQLHHLMITVQSRAKTRKGRATVPAESQPF